MSSRALKILRACKATQPQPSAATVATSGEDDARKMKEKAQPWWYDYFNPTSLVNLPVKEPKPRHQKGIPISHQQRRPDRFRSAKKRLQFEPVVLPGTLPAPCQPVFQVNSVVPVPAVTTATASAVFPCSERTATDIQPVLGSHDGPPEKRKRRSSAKSVSVVDSDEKELPQTPPAVQPVFPVNSVVHVPAVTTSTASAVFPSERTATNIQPVLGSHDGPPEKRKRRSSAKSVSDVDRDETSEFPQTPPAVQPVSGSKLLHEGETLAFGTSGTFFSSASTPAIEKSTGPIAGSDENNNGFFILTPPPSCPQKKTQMKTGTGVFVIGASDDNLDELLKFDEFEMEIPVGPSDNMPARILYEEPLVDASDMQWEQHDRHQNEYDDDEPDSDYENVGADESESDAGSNWSTGEGNLINEDEEPMDLEPDQEPAEERGPEVPPKTPSRKRVQHPSDWAKNVRKEAKNTGKAHTNSKGKAVEAVKMRGNCTCKKNCGQHFSEDQRAEIFQKFWEIGDHTRQWDYITRHSVSEPVKKRTVDAATSRRQSSRHYFLKINGENKPVCKTMFLNTLGIRQGWVDSAYKHLQGSKESMSPDKRGRHPNRPSKLTEEQRQTIRSHINQYPRTPSHYVRARSQREYLEWGLSISKMFRHYKQWCEDENVPNDKRASKSKYSTVMNTEFNLGFFRPKKDRCALCQVIKTGSRNERETYKEKYVNHVKDKKSARKYKNLAKSLGAEQRHKLKVFAFDLQKVLPIPKSEVSTFFYKNKLSLFNLSVFDMVDKKGFCYLWHEAIAKRGANEISSCVLKFVCKCAREKYTELQSFSDSCSGQNKNRYFFASMAYAAAKYGLQWNHCFLEPGHTQNENDSVHAVIEKEAKLKEIFDMDEWIDLIKNAKQEEPKYDVKTMTRKEIFDFHSLVDKQNWKYDSRSREVKWSKVKMVQADPSEHGIFKFKYEYDGEWNELNLRARVGRPVNLKTYQPSPAYQARIPLKQLKFKHLDELCKSLAIPSRYHKWYEGIMQGVEPVENVSDDENENEEDINEDIFFTDTIVRIPDVTRAIPSENADESDADDDGL